MDAGRCNDAYSAVRIAVALGKDFNVAILRWAIAMGGLSDY
jgi:hydroxylamine reductase (hybrid-cluster protein)